MKIEHRDKRLLILATGEKEPGKGGSGFKEMVEFTKTKPRILKAKIAGVISDYPNGGIKTKADELGVDFELMSKPFTAEKFQALVKKYGAKFVFCSGFLQYVKGLPPEMIGNIHPGPLPNFGGLGMYGHHVHEAVIAAYKKGEITQSAVSMHFVVDDPDDGENGKKGYDKGPIFFDLPVIIRPDDTPDTLASRVNEKERAWQSFVLNLVLHGDIQYVDKKTIKVSESAYRILGELIPRKKVKIQFIHEDLKR